MPNTNNDKCRLCQYPLILRKNDDPKNPSHEEEYEDDNNGLCGNCDCGDRISREAIERNKAENNP